jgi:hypothetical protein
MSNFLEEILKSKPGVTMKHIAVALGYSYNAVYSWQVKGHVPDRVLPRLKALKFEVQKTYRIKPD